MVVAVLVTGVVVGATVIVVEVAIWEVLVLGKVAMVAMVTMMTMVTMVTMMTMVTMVTMVTMSSVLAVVGVGPRGQGVKGSGGRL